LVPSNASEATFPLLQVSVVQTFPSLHSAGVEQLVAGAWH